MNCGELLEVYEQGSDMHRHGCPLEVPKTHDITHASGEYEKVYYSHSGIFWESRAWLCFFIVIRGWDQNEGLGFCGFNYPSGAKV